MDTRRVIRERSFVVLVLPSTPLVSQTDEFGLFAELLPAMSS